MANSVRPKWFKGLQPGKLPFKIAQLEIGESLLLECADKKYRSLMDRVTLSSQTKALQHMQFECRAFHCMDLHDARSTITIVKVTRKEDKNVQE